jgi:hypothetical protein
MNEIYRTFQSAGRLTSTQTDGIPKKKKFCLLFWGLGVQNTQIRQNSETECSPPQHFLAYCGMYRRQWSRWEVHWLEKWGWAVAGVGKLIPWSPKVVWSPTNKFQDYSCGCLDRRSMKLSQVCRAPPPICIDRCISPLYVTVCSVSVAFHVV